MNKIICLRRLRYSSMVCIALLTFAYTEAQEVPTRTLVEHFTNTYCSVCASRNPGFYNNLVQFPDALHISYYPSAPYVACPLSQYNVTEQDGRTNFYGVYGSTPRLVINGDVVAANASYNDPALFQDVQGYTTPFDLRVAIDMPHADSVQVSLIIKKVATSNRPDVGVYAAIVEDTLFFNANNGEEEHYNVFRKALWDNGDLEDLPTTIGDSVVYTRSVAYDPVWTMQRVYAIGLIHEAHDKALMQAARSQDLPPTAGVADMPKAKHISVYPNPATDLIYIEGMKPPFAINVTDAAGRVVYSGYLARPALSIASWNSGLHFIKVANGKTTYTARFMKH